MRSIQDGRSPWIRLIIAACNLSNLATQNNVFLGKGAFGRAFRVLRLQEGLGGRNFMALKIVLLGNRGDVRLDLFKEKESLGNAAKISSHVASVAEFHDFLEPGAAMLLADIGSDVPKPVWRQLFQTLGSLHEGNIVHGHPRLSNVIFVGGAVQWIGFRNSPIATNTVSVEVKRRDLGILVKSCYDKRRLPIPVAVEDEVRRYDGTAA